MYGNVHRKIITNSPEAWSLAGVAKRLSFAIDNMNLPIANLVVDTPGGGNVNVFRHGDMEIWNLKTGGRKYFQFKILRDDGTYIGEEEIEGIEIFLDTGERNIIGEVYCPPILYVWNFDPGETPETDPEVIKMRDTLYNLKPDGTRGDVPKKRYDPDTKIWTFDGYQRPWSWMYGDTETDDLTKPTSPPYMEGDVHAPSNKYNPVTGKYKKKTTSGYFVRVRCKKDSVDSYYRKPKKTDPDGQLARGYKYDKVLNHWDQTDASLIQPGHYLFRAPFYKYSSWEESTNKEPGYKYYSYEDWQQGLVDYGKDYFSVVRLAGTHWYSIKNSWGRNVKIKSSVPYTVYEYIRHSISPYTYTPGELDAAAVFSASGAFVSASGGPGEPPERINGQGNYVRTFEPVKIPDTGDPVKITEEEMDEQTHSMSISWSGGARRLDVGRDFIANIYNYVGSLPENEI